MKIGVVGLGTFGSHLVRELAEMGVEVLAVDKREACVDAVKDDAAFAAVVDVTSRDALERLPFADLDAVILTIGDDFKSAMLATAHLLALKPKRLICRAASETHEQLLAALGVTEIVVPERVAAGQVAARLAIRGVTGSYEVAEGFNVHEMTPPAHAVGKSMKELNLRGNYEINLITIKRRDAKGRVHVVGVPGPDFAVAAGDVLVLFGSDKALRRFAGE
jgi:trk system potassium uptake protein TrkA